MIFFSHVIKYIIYIRYNTRPELLPITIFLKLTSYLSKENKFGPLSEAMTGLDEIGPKIRFRPLLFDKFKVRVESL